MSIPLPNDVRTGDDEVLRLGQSKFSQHCSPQGIARFTSQWCVVLILALSGGVGAAVLGTTGVVDAEGARSEGGGSQAPFDLNDPRAVEEGSHLFRANCTHYCHNPEGRAARAPALRGRDLAPDFVY